MSRRAVIQSWLFAVLSVLAQSLSGQNDQFQIFGVEDGLVQSQVECIEQDEKGYLWIGTIGGLSIYNGYNFKTFTSKNGLSEDWVSAINIGEDGNVWMGHWAGGITVFDSKKDAFTKLNAEQFTRFRKINEIIEIGKEKFIAVEGGGIIRYSNEKFSRINLDTSMLRVQDLHYDTKHNYLWATCSGNLLWIDLNESSTKGVFNANTLFDSTYHFNQITPVGDEIWVGTKSEGVARFNFTKSLNYMISSKEKLGVIDCQPICTIDNEIKGMKEFSNYHVWVIGENSIKKWERNADHTLKNYNKILDAEDGNFFQTNVLFEDREKNIWLGTEVGLAKYRGELFSVLKDRELLNSTLVWSTHVDAKGDVWVGSSNGVNRLHFPNKFHNGMEKDTVPVIDSLSDKNVISQLEDYSGKMWFGTESKGINIFDPVTGEMTKLNKASGLVDDHIYSMTKDKKGNVWVGTRNGVSFIQSADSFKITNYKMKDGIGGNKVYKVFHDSKGRTWLGVLGGHLTVYENGSFKHFTKKEGFDSRFTLSVDEDEYGDIWFGCYLGGVYRYNGKEFKHYSVDDGLSSPSPSFVICDDKGSVWVGHNKGLDKINIVESKVSRYTEQYGVHGLETNENSATLDKRGNIWFGTVRGLVKLSPYNERPNLVEPITAIEGLKIQLKDAEFPADNTFDYTQNELTFDVIGVSLTNPDEVSYSYMLEGGFSNWSPKIKERSISFSGLKPGSYVFRLKAYNNHGIETKEEIQYGFTITPPFYLTIPFLAGSGVFVIVMIIVVVKLRERQLRQRQIYLEGVVDERTEELRLEKETVEEQKEEIEQKNHHITSSINYSKKIQDSILPPKEMINEFLPKNFVYFKPRDIVSGDFYWIHRHGNKVLYAAADCTGHGVPGAFMSMIGTTLLNKIVGEYKIFEPAKILDKLSEEIVKTLRQDQGKSVKDGMDIAIVAIDYDMHQLEFAGAYNPLYIVRGGELTELEADVIAIGKSFTGEVKHYTNKTYQLQAGDSLFTFSDGFPDQFGGPKGKKFLYKRFRKLAIELAGMPIEQREGRLDEVMTKWMGERNQLDDMIIFGVEI